MLIIFFKDDHVIVVVPDYQAAETIPLDISDITGVSLRPEENWRLDIDDIAKVMHPNTKLASINVPNNPTGAIFPRSDIVTLVELCREKGIYLFSDMVATTTPATSPVFCLTMSPKEHTSLP